MKKILAVLALLFVGGTSVAQFESNDPSLQYETRLDGSVVITVSPEVAARCIEQGGCAVVSRAWVHDLLSRTCGGGT